MAQLAHSISRSPLVQAQRALAGQINQGAPVAQAKQKLEEKRPSQRKPLKEEKRPAQTKSNLEEKKTLQGMLEGSPVPVQLEEASAPAPNRTGLPDGLKTGVESLSRISLDNVRVHYNSSEPAQLNALAYAQGSDIHVAPGQEKHLPHEAWHVVQQAQGRVQPTKQMKGGIPINDEVKLEHEADVMGGKALQMRNKTDRPETSHHTSSIASPIQRRVIFLGNTGDYATLKVLTALQSPGTITSTDDPPQPAVEQDETIYVVGHGRPEGVWALEHEEASFTTDLSELAGRIYEVIPKGWKGQVTVLTCRAGAPMEDPMQENVVHKLTTLLSEMLDYPPKVIGAKGFSLGVPDMGDKTRVLNPTFEIFYHADFGNADNTTLLKALGKSDPPDTARRRAKAKGEDTEHKKKKWTEKPTTKSQASDSGFAWATIKQEIETELAACFEDAKQQAQPVTVTEILTLLKKNSDWNRLMAEQKQEYETFGLFFPAGKGFTE